MARQRRATAAWWFLRSWLLPITLLALNVTNEARSQASFDCEVAQSVIEKAICRDPKVAFQDSQLAQEIRNILKNRKEMRTAILASERDWVAKRDLQCEPLTHDGKALRDCLEGQYSARITELYSIDMFEDDASQLAALEGDWYGVSRSCANDRFAIRGRKIKRLGCKWTPFVIFPDTTEPDMLGKPENGSDQVTAIELQGTSSACPSSVMVFEVYKANSPCSAAWINVYESRAKVGTGSYGGGAYECRPISKAHRQTFP